jgi:hypothetical protein
MVFPLVVARPAVPGPPLIFLGPGHGRLLLVMVSLAARPKACIDQAASIPVDARGGRMVENTSTDRLITLAVWTIRDRYGRAG